MVDLASFFRRRRWNKQKVFQLSFVVERKKAFLQSRALASYLTGSNIGELYSKLRPCNIKLGRALAILSWHVMTNTHHIDVPHKHKYTHQNEHTAADERITKHEHAHTLTCTFSAIRQSQYHASHDSRRARTQTRARAYTITCTQSKHMHAHKHAHHVWSGRAYRVTTKYYLRFNKMQFV